MLLSSYLLSFTPQLWVNAFSHLQSSAREDQQQQQLTTNQAITIRNATLDKDADDIARVLVDAFDPSPIWQYIYQFKDDHPAYHLECKRNQTVDLIQMEQDGVEVFAHVIDAPPSMSPPGSTTGTELNVVVAVAIWGLIRKGELPPSTSSSSSPLSLLTAATRYSCRDHLDANMTRADHLNRQLAPLEHRYVRSPDHDQLYLAMLATHPDWQHRGLGEAHLRWGQEFAKARNVNITLVATPAGYPVYRAAGFEGLENVTVTKVEGDGDGDDDGFWYEGMMWRP